MARILGTSATRLLTAVFVVTALTCLCPTLSPAQKRAGGAEEENPVFREYRGVQIGMTTEEARKKLGNPKDKGDEQDFYIFSEQETTQIVYDKTHKVSVLSVDFSSGAPGVPTCKTVMGAEIEPKADGSMYKMVRYAKAGYWVSYNRTAGNTPMITITLQKID
ncbi:MAG: hypothetical protein JWM21_2582 [Acidobacteria bacterium]|nr:hypothetical protein [Acidobacteriota bacterium]